MNKKMMSKRFLWIVVAVVLATALVIPAVVVSADTATATRTLPASVEAGADFDVGIVASGCGAMGQVVETLPAGFSYVSCVSEDVLVTQEDNVVKFTFMSDAVSFDYTVAASTTEGVYTFSGVVKDEDKVESPVGGATSITVGAPPATSATRTLPALVDPGANFDVGIVASGCGVMGEVEETLPAGFSYVSCVSEDVAVTQEDNVVRFTFMGDGVTFDYTVAASTTEGVYTFSGVVKDENKVEYPVGGATSITVGPVVVEPVELEFSGSLTKGEWETLLTPDIPGGATELEITLVATADIDLELYYGTTFVIGWKAIITSSSSTTRTYQGDTFAYSGWDGGDEDIKADGPLSRAYTLKVYGYEAGNYVVTVSYMPGPPDETPPEITITAPDATVGVPTTIVVSATDLSGVMLIWFGVFPEEYPPEWKDDGPVAALCTFTDEGSLTFTPGWAETYIVLAMAVDNSEAHNATPEDAPVTATFVVAE